MPTRDDRSARWPDLTLSGWSDTKDTIHLWTQIVGKVRMAFEPRTNHWWEVPLYVSARGLTTSLVPGPAGGFDAELDFVDHELVVRTTSGERRVVPLVPRSIADFYGEVTDVLGGLGIRPDLLARPVEVPVAVPFPEDVAPRPYDAGAAHRYWLALVQADRLLDRFRARFRGKASPVHLFWGALDLATTRFSGRTAPQHPGGVPNCADWVMHEAYSHELSSCGFWPGGSDEGSFYAYAYPQPDGFSSYAPALSVPGASWSAELGEYLLPYRAVRSADDPDALVLAFLQETYAAAAELGGWDRAALEVA
jgi:hypothetical protein